MLVVGRAVTACRVVVARTPATPAHRSAAARRRDGGLARHVAVLAGVRLMVGFLLLAVPGRTPAEPRAGACLRGRWPVLAGVAAVAPAASAPGPMDGFAPRCRNPLRGRRRPGRCCRGCCRSLRRSWPRALDRGGAAPRCRALRRGARRGAPAAQVVRVRRAVLARSLRCPDVLATWAIDRSLLGRLSALVVALPRLPVAVASRSCATGSTTSTSSSTARSSTAR